MHRGAIKSKRVGFISILAPRRYRTLSHRGAPSLGKRPRVFIELTNCMHSTYPRMRQNDSTSKPLGFHSNLTLDAIKTKTGLGETAYVGVMAPGCAKMEERNNLMSDRTRVP